MKWRENMAMKALAFMAAVGGVTPPAHTGGVKQAKLDALWSNAK